MVEFKLEAKHLIVASTCVVAGVWYFISRNNSKGRQFKHAHISEEYHQSQFSEWLSRTFSTSKLGGSLEHPEGPNLGFKSNNSWFTGNGESTAKIDLLHQGHTKGGKLIIVMVGLPGRGKTYIARKIARYLRWISYRTRAFSLAKYRLDKLGSKTADFFDPTVSSYSAQRQGVLVDALEDALRYLSRGGEIAIMDGTNYTKDRRDLIRDRVSKEPGYEVLWIESIITQDGEVSEEQFDALKNSPDFIDKEDYLRRLELYKQNYETLTNGEGSFVKVYDDGRELVLHEIFGFLRTKIVSFLMNLHTSPRPVYLIRHGESEFNVKNLIGGDSNLSPMGVEFSQALGDYLHNQELSPKDSSELCVWTSNMKRSKQTAVEVRAKKLVEWRALREIEVGICDGLSYEQVQVQFPEEFRARQHDKLKYRYPRGESYLDVITRLEPVLFEMERQREPLVIVAHQAVVRCLYAYFLDLPAEEIPFLSIPLHTLIKLEVSAYGCKEKRVRIVTKNEPTTYIPRRTGSQMKLSMNY